MKLFDSDRKNNTNTFIGDRSDKMLDYVLGYFQAAETLSKDFSLRHDVQKSELIYPIIFLYRHHIELSLKYVIKTLNKLINTDALPKGDVRTAVKETDKKITSAHILVPLWERAISLVIKCIEDYKLPDEYSFSKFHKHKSIIEELESLDKLSFTFRYPTTKSGDLVLPDIDYINLDQFRTEILKVIEVTRNMMLVEVIIEDYKECCEFNYKWEG